MKVFIPNTQEDRLRQILNRVGLSFEPEVELLKCMLLRQFLLFAMQPKSYVVAIYQKYRVRKDVDQLNIKNVESEENGTVIEADDKKGLFIKTCDGVISVIEIQGENAKKMPIADFLRGNHLICTGVKFI